jgi:hypothetical protein
MGTACVGVDIHYFHNLICNNCQTRTVFPMNKVNQRLKTKGEIK